MWSYPASSLFSYPLCFVFFSLSFFACLLACLLLPLSLPLLLLFLCVFLLRDLPGFHPPYARCSRALTNSPSVCLSLGGVGDEGCRTGAAGAAIVEGEGGGIRGMILQVSACLAGALVWMTGWLSGEISVEVCQRKGCLSPTEAIHCPLAGLIAALEACLLA